MAHETLIEALFVADDAIVNTHPRVAALCRTILALDQSIDADIRSAHLTRLDFDMLLDLYVAEHDGRTRCLWDVCQAASAPFSTAHRHLSGMIARDLVMRLAPGGDWRRVIVRCSGKIKLLLEALTDRFEANEANFFGTSLMGQRRAPHRTKLEPGV